MGEEMFCSDIKGLDSNSTHIKAGDGGQVQAVLQAVIGPGADVLVEFQLRIGDAVLALPLHTLAPPNGRGPRSC